MRHLLDSLQASLALSPVGIAVQLPGGLRLGDANAELRDVVLQVRMMPIGETFNKFKRRKCSC